MYIKKFLLVDLLNRGESHKLFNSQVINDALSENKMPQGIFHKTVNYLNDFENFRIKFYVHLNTSTHLYRWVLINIILVYILARYRREKIIFLHLPPLSQYIVCKFSEIFGTKVILYLHGELSYLITSTSIGQKLGSKMLTYILTERTSYVEKRCLSKIVLDNLKRMLAVNEDLVVFETYNQKTCADDREIPYNQHSKTILVPGIVARSKSHLLVNILAKNVTISPSYRIIVYGKTDGSLAKIDFDEKITTVITDYFIPDSDYIKMIESSRIVLIPQLFNSSYELVTSGVLETCIKLCVPIIGKEGGLLSEIEKSVGPVGILLKSSSELETFDFGSITDDKCINFHDNLTRYREISQI